MLKRLLLLAFLGVCTLSASGCIFLAAGAAGAGTAKWLSDKVSQEIAVAPQKVSHAVEGVFKDSQISITSENMEQGVVQIRGLDQQSRKVWVDVHTLTPNSSEVEVRVGWVSGEADARKLLEKIVNRANSWL